MHTHTVVASFNISGRGAVAVVDPPIMVDRPGIFDVVVRTPGREAIAAEASQEFARSAGSSAPETAVFLLRGVKAAQVPEGTTIECAS